MLYIVFVILLMIAFAFVFFGITEREFRVALIGLIPAVFALACGLWVDSIITNNRCIEATEVARYEHLKEMESDEENTLKNDYIFSSVAAPDQYLLYYYPTDDSTTYERYSFSSSKVTVYETDAQNPMVVVYELYQRCKLNFLERILVFGETSKFKGMKYEIYLPKNAIETEM